MVYLNILADTLSAIYSSAQVRGSPQNLDIIRLSSVGSLFCVRDHHASAPIIADKRPITRKDSRPSL